MIEATKAIAAFVQNKQHAAPSDHAVSDLASQFEAVMARADTSAVGAMSGTTPTHELVQSLTEAEFALDAALAVRDKVVEAYQELLRMPV